MFLSERYLGCLIGLATGDAIGTTVEFSAPGSFAPVKDMTGGGPFNLKCGEWTDDTSMALCLAQSLLETGRFDAADQMDRYLLWWKKGHLSSNGKCFDIGNTVLAALQKYQNTQTPFAGSTAANTAGNGSLMRLGPVVLAFARNPELAIEMAALSSLTTHGATVAVDACRYLAALLLGALDGATKEDLLADHFSPVPGYWEKHPLCPEIAIIANGSFKQEPPAIQGTGYAAKSLEAAMWAFHKSQSFHEGCLLAVNLGDDADTTAAIFGQLAGAFWGIEGIPEQWRRKLAKRELLEEFAIRLLRLAQSNPTA